MTSYTTLLFDVDGTLLDFEKSKERALREIMIENQLEFNQDLLHTFSRFEGELWSRFEKGELSKEFILVNRFKRFFEHLGIEKDYYEFEELYQERLGRYADMIPYAYEICELLSKDYSMQIITNGVTKTQLSRLEISGLTPFFENIFISDAIGYAKPKKEYFDAVLNQIAEKDRSKILIIGDSMSSDIQGGHNSGIDTCWVNLTGIENNSDIQADYEISDLRELIEIVK